MPFSFSGARFLRFLPHAGSLNLPPQRSAAVGFGGRNRISAWLGSQKPIFLNSLEQVLCKSKSGSLWPANSHRRLRPYPDILGPSLCFGMFWSEGWYRLTLGPGPRVSGYGRPWRSRLAPWRSRLAQAIRENRFLVLKCMFRFDVTQEEGG
ncbi:hypothetical protein MRB53_018731 [Persea americana]|uniref:Uncharacterized protein n=1 Tax=Persea americana TaxID=3435 RepID=A0ACC2M8R7_PERAE|nr:hypothetical protein MRB53_018731 [Persea americana]|eukprot:TRINITY_DN28377_c0_g3_i1.p1 TRINITY_DN28377_c0_g3~~TRINITY_DN28377_c0_g3_i1.p1  ORF type:complete len:151 (+),score=14.21 TRINITY_DN28377_c0_g3_i1:151-603(+)